MKLFFVHFFPCSSCSQSISFYCCWSLCFSLFLSFVESMYRCCRCTHSSKSGRFHSKEKTICKINTEAVCFFDHKWSFPFPFASFSRLHCERVKESQSWLEKKPGERSSLQKYFYHILQSSFCRCLCVCEFSLF